MKHGKTWTVVIIALVSMGATCGDMKKHNDPDPFAPYKAQIEAGHYICKSNLDEVKCSTDDSTAVALPEPWDCELRARSPRITCYLGIH